MIAEKRTDVRDQRRIYLAGPLGFSEVGRTAQESLFSRIEVAGYEVLDPFQLTPQDEFDRIARLGSLEEQRDAWRVLNRRIGDTNRQAIDARDVLFAVLDGSDVNSGTAAEIGYAYARGKTIVGYRGDFRLAADNPGAIVNLQVEYFVQASGGEIVVSLEAVAAAIDRAFRDRRVGKK